MRSPTLARIVILEIIPTAIRSHWSRFALFGRHEIDRELKAMSARLDEHGELSSLTAEELCRHGVKQTGREKSVLHRTNGAIRADAREQINHALLTSARQGMLESRLMDGHKAGALRV